jgi:DNA invertase Pin-like site-specific DNA recombinase
MERTGRKGSKTKSLDEGQIVELSKLFKEGMSKSKLALGYNVSRVTIMRTVKPIELNAMK